MQFRVQQLWNRDLVPFVWSAFDDFSHMLLHLPFVWSAFVAYACWFCDAAIMVSASSFARGSAPWTPHDSNLARNRKSPGLRKTDFGWASMGCAKVHAPATYSSSFYLFNFIAPVIFYLLFWLLNLSLLSFSLSCHQFSFDLVFLIASMCAPFLQR